MALTILEAAKKNPGDVLKQAVVEIYAKNSDLLRVLPFEDIPGNALKYNREETLPGIGFRGVNEAYTEGTGIVNPVVESLIIAGGDLDVDKFIIDTQGADQRAVQEAMKIKALSLRITKSFIKGDHSSEPREFDGLQVRCAGNQLVSSGSTSGGDVLSLAKLDELIDAVEEPMYLVMNKTMRRRLTTAARTYTVGGFITWQKDEFGRRVDVYNGLPILIADKDNENSDILPLTESGAGGGTAQCTSIYCLSVADGMLTGLQNGEIDVRDLGELQTKPAFRTRVEWYMGMAIYHPKAAGRLYGIKDGAVTA